MNHRLKIRHLGPIDECELTINKFTVFTGPQSNGKSTIAKAIYYFRTIKQDVLNLMMQGGPSKVSDKENASWEYVLKQRLRDKFMQLFGTSWIMPDDMEMTYIYKKGNYIRVFLVPDDKNYDSKRNFIDIEFSQNLQDYLSELEYQSFDNISVGQKEHAAKALEERFADIYETVFIPAGRNLITLLSTQLNFIFTSLEGTQLRNIDYITKRYTELILKLKPSFSEGFEGMLFDACQDPERTKRYKLNRVAIDLLLKCASDVLRGKYRYVEGEERLYLDEKRYVKINLASSGQQEIVWVFNILFYYLLENKKVFIILEEPESHLYPESQQKISEILALFYNSSNGILITTHSPYVLGTLNYLLLAQQTGLEIIKTKVHKRYWIDPKSFAAYYICNGGMECATNAEDNLTLIRNELIDDASLEINEMIDFILEQSFEEAPND